MAPQTPYKHREAFCLMLYQSQTSKRVLDIWNSRDGVTPFCAFIDDEEYMHIAFSFDRCMPEHRLRPGDYFWRDMTPIEAHRIAASRIDRFEPHLSARERDNAIAELVPEIGKFDIGPAPYLDRAPFIALRDDG